EYLLIDSPGEDYRGGSGKTFSWELLDELDIPREKLILAGGLSSENINQAIKLVRPFGVDVSSGVETNKQKDHEKIKSFITHAKQGRCGIILTTYTMPDTNGRFGDFGGQFLPELLMPALHE